MANNVKLPAKLRGYPPHMFANWTQHAEPPNDVPAAPPPNPYNWRVYEPRPGNVVGQPRTVQAAAGAPVAASYHPDVHEDDEAQFRGDSSADAIPPSHEQRTEEVAPSQNPPLSIHVNGVPIAPTDGPSVWRSLNQPPVSASYLSQVPPLDASHSSRFHPYRPPRPEARCASQHATHQEETYASTSRVHSMEAPYYSNHSDVQLQGTAHESDTQVRLASHSGLYPRFSVDAATGAYCWVGTMDPAALNDPAFRADPSRFMPLPEAHLAEQLAQVPPFGYLPAPMQDVSVYGQTEQLRFGADSLLPENLPNLLAQFAPLGYPPAVPQDMRPLGQNDVAGPFQLYPREGDDEDVSMDDQDDLYSEEDAYFHGDVPDMSFPEQLPPPPAPSPPFEYSNIVPVIAPPNVLPREIPVFQNDAVGHFQPHPQDDVAMDDEQDPYHEGNVYLNWDVSASGSQDGGNMNLPNVPVAGPSADHQESFAVDLDVLNAMRHAGFPPPWGWPRQPHDENSQSPSGSEGQW